MADDDVYSPKLWLEAWTRPGHATFGRLDPDVPVRRCSFTRLMSGSGQADAIIPTTYPRFAELVYSDPDTPANAASSLLRIMAEGHTGPLFEWIPTSRAAEADAVDPDIEIPGQGIESVLGYARTECWDWAGGDDEQSRFPDWIWGGRNVLGDINCRAIAERVTLTKARIDDGTFTITVINDLGTETTGAIAYDETALGVDVALTALANVTFVEVDETSDGWRLSFQDASTGWIISANSSGLVGQWRLDVDATGGTFTVTIDGNASGNIAWNADAAALKAAIEAVTGITTVTVTKDVSADPNHGWIIEFDNPDSVSTFTANAGGLSGGASTAVPDQLDPLVSVTVDEQGNVQPLGWEISRSFLTEIDHGTVIEFRCWETGDPALPAGCTAAFMFNGLEPMFPGVQKVQAVKAGGIYQASAYVTGGNVGDTIRMVIRDIAENEIASVEATIAVAGTWQLITLTDVRIPEGVDEVIFRFGHVDEDGVDPGRLFVACPELNEGLAPTSVGGIIQALYADATVDHVADGRLVWDDGSGTNTPYLTLDFDDLVDSNGDAWDDPIVSLTIKRGMSYLGVMGEIGKLGYEWRVVPDDWQQGTWLWQIYNPGGMGTDRSADPTPTIEGGRDITRRDVRMFLPGFTDIAVEGGGQNVGRDRNAALIAALGRIEGYKPEQDLNTLAEAGAAAAAAAAGAADQSLSLTYTIAPADPTHPLPLSAYDVGDLLKVQDPPDVVKQTRRVASLQGVFGADQTTEFVAQLGTVSYVGQMAVQEAVRILTAEFKAIRAGVGECCDPFTYPPLASYYTQSGTPGGIADDVREYSYNLEAAKFVHTWPMPNNLAIGDYAWFAVQLFGGSPASITDMPAGYTADVDLTDSTVDPTHYYIFRKVIDGTESDSTFTVDEHVRVSLVSWRTPANGSTLPDPVYSIVSTDVAGGVGDGVDCNPVSGLSDGRHAVYVVTHANKGAYVAPSTGYSELGYIVSENVARRPRTFVEQAEIDVVGGSENPGDIDWNDTSGFRQYRTWTIAVALDEGAPSVLSPGSDHDLLGNREADANHPHYALIDGSRAFTGPVLMDEQAGDPATPATGQWWLYFKAGGLFVMDDTGTVTGPLS